jgi:hypothetical protein
VRRMWKLVGSLQKPIMDRTSSVPPPSNSCGGFLESGLSSLEVGHVLDKSGGGT